MNFNKAESFSLAFIPHLPPDISNWIAWLIPVFLKLWNKNLRQAKQEHWEMPNRKKFKTKGLIYLHLESLVDECPTLSITSILWRSIWSSYIQGKVMQRYRSTKKIASMPLPPTYITPDRILNSYNVFISDQSLTYWIARSVDLPT